MVLWVFFLPLDSEMHY